ncbi:MAG: hypothetical protein M1812_001413 [Candelaria pacifica]|nr:MAG: hypothetical protein M1812_001413 [Candelaria pacifica]
MATLAPLSSPMRQPFASLDSPRLRNLTNTKNRQNALPTVPSSSVKRRYAPPTIFDDVDSENIDPSSVSSTAKRAKLSDSLPSKKSHFILTDSQPSLLSLAKPAVSRSSTLRLETPQSSLGQKRKTAAPSTLPAAGRSPKSKRIGILCRRRASGSPFTRVDPPSYGQPRAASFSIDAALSGSIPTYAPRPESKTVEEVTVHTLDESLPKGWVFNIHEDTADDEMANIMQHSTCTLDISDDEGSRAAKNDRGKENIPPLDHLPSVSATAANDSNNNIAVSSTTATQTKSRRPIAKMMMEEDRSPLGDLAAADFYGEGLTAESYILVPVGPSEKAGISNEAKQAACATPVHPQVSSSVVPKEEHKESLVKVEGSSLMDSAGEIKIWESEPVEETETKKNGEGEVLTSGNEVPTNIKHEEIQTAVSESEVKVTEDVVMA